MEIPNSSMCYFVMFTQLNVYLCHDSLVDIWKKNTHKLKEKMIFLLHSKITKINGLPVPAGYCTQ